MHNLKLTIVRYVVKIGKFSKFQKSDDCQYFSESPLPRTASEYTETTTQILHDRLRPLTNTEVRRLDVTHPPDDMRQQFDLVLVNDVIHDLADPQGGLSGCHKVLKHGGCFAFFDIDGYSDVAENKDKNPDAAMFYATSCFHCVPSASLGPGSVALGACWGRDTAVRMAEEAGFTVVSVNRHRDETFVFLVCQKKE